jgi:hypothetical protein
MENNLKEKRPISQGIINVLIMLLLIPVGLISGLYLVGWGLILRIAMLLVWGRRDVLFIYSDSPHWKAYLETEIFPALRERMVLLNWSERKKWKSGSLAALAFNHFGGDQDINPMALVFRPFHFTKKFSFYQAFKKYKHGDGSEVEKMKKDLFQVLNIQM